MAFLERSFAKWEKSVKKLNYGSAQQPAIEKSCYNPDTTTGNIGATNAGPLGIERWTVKSNKKDSKNIKTDIVFLADPN